jgi:hypothetical protein
MSKNEESLQLIYVLSIGKNSKGENIYEFLFSENPEDVDVESWNWDQSPAIEHKEFSVPTEDYVDASFTLTTKSVKLKCLHDARDRSYMHGYHLIHALAYEEFEDDDEESYIEEFEEMYEESNDDAPILVFHYFMRLKDVKDRLYERNLMLYDNSVPNAKAILK